LDPADPEKIYAPVTTPIIKPITQKRTATSTARGTLPKESRLKRIMSFEMGLPVKRLPVLLLPVYFIYFTSCTAIRTIWWGHVDVNDYKKFPSLPVKHSSSPLLFNNKNEPLPGDSLSFDNFLEVNQTLCFIILRNDSILYEKYFKGYTKESVFPSFSIAKSFVSALTGIAIQEKFIHNLQQPVTDFIPEIKDTGFRNVTLENLLTMRSGIRFEEGYSSPFGEIAKFYYGKNLMQYTLGLKTETRPGITYNYQSANAQLMALVLERATGKKINEYLEEKIWKPAGMEYDATWSTDSKRDGNIKAFCCLNARGMDFARFGELFLHGGKNGPAQVIPEDWIKETFTIRNDSQDSEGIPYTYFWRVTEKGNVFAKGVLGQYIFICPRKKIVVVRFGEGAGTVTWTNYIERVVEKLL
jgi:hypothetical protein